MGRGGVRAGHARKQEKEEKTVTQQSDENGGGETCQLPVKKKVWGVEGGGGNKEGTQRPWDLRRTKIAVIQGGGVQVKCHGRRTEQRGKHLRKSDDRGGIQSEGEKGS